MGPPPAVLPLSYMRPRLHSLGEETARLIIDSRTCPEQAPKPLRVSKNPMQLRQDKKKKEQDLPWVHFDAIGGQTTQKNNLAKGELKAYEKKTNRARSIRCESLRSCAFTDGCYAAYTAPQKKSKTRHDTERHGTSML